MSNPLSKYVSESRIFTFDFSAFPEIVAGETLSTPAVTSDPSDLTIGTPSASTPKVTVRLSGGTASREYTIFCSVHTSASNVLVQAGTLYIKGN